MILEKVSQHKRHLADALKYIYKGLNNNDFLIKKNFNLSQAFDTVKYLLLLTKLESVEVLLKLA